MTANLAHDLSALGVDADLRFTTVVALRADGKTWEEIAGAVGLTREGLRLWRERNPQYLSALAELNAERGQRMMLGLQAKTSRAVEVLSDGLEGKATKVQITSANSVLGIVLRHAGMTLEAQRAADANRAAAEMSSEELRTSILGAIDADG